MARVRRPKSDDQRIARKFYLMQPQVRQRMAIRRALKKHLSPPTVTFGVGVFTPPGTRKH